MSIQEGTINSYGYKIHYVKWGETGPKILLIHSMGVDAHSMDLLAESLKKTHQILSLTILGHGDSDSPTTPLPLNEHAEIMRSCYKQLSFHPSVLIGHSVGGMMGMILAAEHPNEFNGLVLVDIAPFDSTNRPTRPPPPEYFKDEKEARAYFMERYPGFTAYYLDNRVKYALRRVNGKLKLKPTGDSVRSGLAIDLWPYVERIKTPTLLLIGEDSTLVTPDTRRRMEETVPRIRVEVVKGAGHMIPQNQPAKFEQLIRSFLETKP